MRLLDQFRKSLLTILIAASSNDNFGDSVRSCARTGARVTASAAIRIVATMGEAGT
jgi:hypothetical protein